MGGKRKTLLSLVSVLIFLTGCSPSKNSYFDLEKITESRPSKKEYLFDYAGVLEEAKEYANGYLNRYRKLSRCYGRLYLQASKTDFQKEGYRELAIRMFKRAETTPSENSRRVDWLRYWLKKKGVLSVKS